MKMEEKTCDCFKTGDIHKLGCPAENVVYPKKPFVKTSVVHKDIGEHNHEMVIYSSYETYAVCKKCGLHDWSHPKGWAGDTSLVPFFKEKYPEAEVDNMTV